MADPKDDKSQADKFANLARELGCDEDEAAFDETLRRVAKGTKPDAADKPKEAR